MKCYFCLKEGRLEMDYDDGRIKATFSLCLDHAMKSAEIVERIESPIQNSFDLEDDDDEECYVCERCGFHSIHACDVLDGLCERCFQEDEEQ